MNTDRSSAILLARRCADLAREMQGTVDVGICPPSVYLDPVYKCVDTEESGLRLGAQDCAAEPNGAHTGDISTSMLRDIGVRFSLAGHSERRHGRGETDEAVSAKVGAIVEAGLMCILCVGETEEERNAGKTESVTQRQVTSGLAGVSAEQRDRIVIAYEPVWAIGTGNTATPEDAQTAHASIREVVASMWGADAAGSLRIQYGGSVKPGNAGDLFACPDVDGGLIGGASLEAESFEGIVRAAAEQAA